MRTATRFATGRPAAGRCRRRFPGRSPQAHGIRRMRRDDRTADRPEWPCARYFRSLASLQLRRWPAGGSSMTYRYDLDYLEPSDGSLLGVLDHLLDRGVLLWGELRISV